MRAGKLARFATALTVGVALAAGVGAGAEAGELIRYRRADGSVGFAGDPSGVPDGAVVMTRRPISESSPASAGRRVPPLAEMQRASRERCEARWSRDHGMLVHCVERQSRDAALYRNMLLDHPPSSEGRALIAGCRSQSGDGGTPNFSRALECASKARSEFLARHGSDPASLDRTRQPDRDGSARRRVQRAEDDRLQRLRDDQDRADLELEKGRRTWGPRYRKAEREFEQAEARTRSIVERMRNRGCRRDTLACGGLGTKLENARRVEALKRDYLRNGIVNECRVAGCQPGWLR